MNKNYTLEELSAVAEEVLATATHKMLLFYGEMGVGKTTLIKEICKQLNVEDAISSPTFSLVNEYKTTKNDTVYHFDFYRIQEEEEAYDIGVEDYFSSENWCLIEWPENIENILPEEATKITLATLTNGLRNLQINQK